MLVTVTGFGSVWRWRLRKAQGHPQRLAEIGVLQHDRRRHIGQRTPAAQDRWLRTLQWSEVALIQIIPPE